VVAAIAGDIEAQELLNGDNAAQPALDAPEQDYSVLDADSSQRSAISAVLSGHSLVIHGPPGTGKSQTIANLIAALVARGRKVLFVAEKRAAIDAVLSRLKSVDLGEAVLDIHEGTRDRQRIARDLGDTLDLAQRTEAPEVAGLHRRLVDRQRRLNEHVSGLHEVHQPWGLTPFEIQSALLGIPEQARTPVRLAAPELITWAGSRSARRARPGTARGCPPRRRRGTPATWRPGSAATAFPCSCTTAAGLRRRPGCGPRAATARQPRLFCFTHQSHRP